MASFFKAMGNDLEKAAGYVGGILHQGLSEVESFGTSAEHYMESATDEAFSTANHVISGAEGLGKDVIDKGAGVIKGGENIIALPLILLTGGLALFMLSSNGGKAIEVGGRLGEKALQNPGLMI